MKKKIHPRSLKRYKPVRVVNPGPLHTVRVHPRQGIKLVQYVKGIKINSDYLYLEKEEENNKAQTVYHIQQKYDLTDWAKTSEIYLGEVSTDGSKLAIYHCSESADDILTVINPNDYVIKLEPHRTIEIVCHGSELPDCQWGITIEDIEIESENIFVKVTDQIVVPVDRDQNHELRSLSGRVVVPRHQKIVNPQLPEDDRTSIAAKIHHDVKPKNEHHFWLSFTPESRKRISQLKDGNYPCSHVVLEERSNEKTEGRHKLKMKWEFILTLSKHGKPVASSKMFKNITPVDDKPAVLRRNQDKHGCILQNPGNTEAIDFITGYEDYTIEIAYPRVFWPEESNDATWQVAYDEVHKDRYLSLSVLEPREKDGVRFQRFRVERKQGVETPPGSDFLGAIKIVYPPKKHFTDASKRIAVWMAGKKKPMYRLTGTDHHHWKQGLGYYSSTSLKLAIVTIEEIPIKSLEDKANTLKLYYRSYYADYDKAYYGVPVKKKDAKPASPGNLMNKGTGENASGTTTHTTTTGGHTEPIVLYNPAHLHEVTLFPEQELHLRLSPPEELLVRQDERDQCRGEMWTVNPMAVSDSRPIVLGHRVIEIGKEKYRQEAKIKVDANRVPNAAGTHIVGYIRLECSAVARVVKIYVRKDVTQKTFCSDSYHFIENLQKHEANGRRYLLANHWKHSDAIKISPTEILYIKNPAPPDGWDKDWSVQFVQHAITPEIWGKLPNNIRDLVDRHRPWYTKETPVHMKGHLVFKPMQDSAKVLTDLIRHLHKLVKADHLLVLTLIYENFKTNIANTESGIVENRQKLIRELNICVTLRNEVLKRNFRNLVNGQEITCPVGDFITINLTPKIDITGGLPLDKHWTCHEYTNILRYDGTSYTTSNTAFHFEAKIVGRGILKFRCKEEELSVNVTVT